MATSTSGDWTPGDQSPSLLPGVTSHGDVTEATPGDQTRHLVTGQLAADGGTSVVTSPEVEGVTSYHVTHSRPIRSLENIQNLRTSAILYTTPRDRKT